MEITQERVRELFDCREDGSLFWANDTSPRARKGQLAGNMKSDGYLKIGIGGKRYKRSQLVYLYHFGYIPECVDHINGDTTNDSIDNLRDASRALNSYNKKIMKTNSSGKAGVSFVSRLGLWRARINVDGKEISLRYHKKFEDAVNVRKEAELKYYGEYSPA